MWTCPKCESKVDPAFEVCWNCGTSPSGVVDPSFVTADDAGAIEDAAVTPDLGLDAGPIGPGGGDLVEAYQARDLMEAEFLADQLKEAQIPAIPDAQDFHESLGIMTSTPRVWVRAEDLGRARTWLEAYERDKKDSAGL